MEHVLEERKKNYYDQTKFYNQCCIQGAKDKIKNNSIDLIITDPPYAIEGDKLDRHYNRKEENVLNGYIEIPKEEYYEFSYQWIKEAERVLKENGSIYIISGYTNLGDILNVLKETSLKLINHIIWKYNFGVYTKRKYVSSHYHILYYTKSQNYKHIFNTYAYYREGERDIKNKSLNYADREDVWIINREYQTNKIKNKNQLPTKLLQKMINYSSNEDDIICDFFAGSFSTAKESIKLKRNAVGFELNKEAYDYQTKQMKELFNEQRELF